VSNWKVNIRSKCYQPQWYAIGQGFSTFWYPRTPKIKIVPLCVPPNQNCMPFAYPQIQNSTRKGLFWAGFFNFAYPLLPSHVPLGVRVPQVENRCYRQRHDLPLVLARKASSRMTSVSIMAASNLFIYFYFYLLFYIFKTPHSILSMHADERSARRNNRFSGSVCRRSLTITMQLIEDFIGPARLLILWLEIFNCLMFNC
jgi:hypothetical protein